MSSSGNGKNCRHYDSNDKTESDTVLVDPLKKRKYVGNDASEITEELLTSIQKDLLVEDLQEYDAFQGLNTQHSTASSKSDTFLDSMVAFHAEQYARMEHELLSNTVKGDAPRVISNYRTAYTYLKDQLNKFYSLEFIFSLHRAVGKDIYATAGQIRITNVRAGQRVSSYSCLSNTTPIELFLKQF